MRDTDPVAGWYPDPRKEVELRWWDGSRWTHHTQSSAATPSPTSGSRPDSALQSAPPTREDLAWTARPGEPSSEQDKHGGRSGRWERLFGAADRIAVVDVETTGLYNQDRIVEIGIVTPDREGAVVDEFETLVNPGRDVGPTWLHQITGSMLIDAPTFDQVASHVAARLDGCVVAAHNIAFDTRMLGNEFERVDIDVDWGIGLDTLALTGCKLGVACQECGVEITGAHRALADARAVARLLPRLAHAFEGDFQSARLGPIRAGTVPCRVKTRDGQTIAEVPTRYLALLARGVHAEPDLAPYMDLLDVVVADLKLTDQERLELGRLAGALGLVESDVRRAHRAFIEGLVDMAADNALVTDEEYEGLLCAAALLGVAPGVIDQRVESLRAQEEEIDLVEGMGVCFTGEVVIDGQRVAREEVIERAVGYGLEPVGSVSKKRCHLLVAADPMSRSTKASKARKIGVPIASIEDFLVATGTGTPADRCA